MKAEFRENYIKMGLKIAYYRKLKSLSQEQLAEQAGLGAEIRRDLER